MMREWATVIEWRNGIATLICERQSGCSGCQSHSSCGMKVLNKLGSDKNSRELKIPIPQPLAVGQRVELGIDESILLKSALLIYSVPLLFLFLGLFFAYLLLGSDDLSLVLGAGVGIVTGFIIARFYAIRMERNVRYHPLVLNITTSADS